MQLHMVFASAVCIWNAEACNTYFNHPFQQWTERFLELATYVEMYSTFLYFQEIV